VDSSRYDAEDTNFYRYVLNAPINYIDVFGLEQQDPWKPAKEAQCEDNCQQSFNNCLKFANGWWDSRRRRQCQPLLDNCLQYCKSNNEKCPNPSDVASSPSATIATVAIVADAAAGISFQQKTGLRTKIGLGGIGAVASILAVYDASDSIAKAPGLIRRKIGNPQFFTSVTNELESLRGQLNGDKCNGSWTINSRDNLTSHQAVRLDWFTECGTDTVWYVTTHKDGMIIYGSQSNGDCKNGSCLSSDKILRIITEVRAQ
jgi:hypothetical protein